MPYDQERINYYCELFSNQKNPQLTKTENYINLHSPNPSLSSDFTQGRFLSFISKLLKPKRILEVGTFLGYSTLCLAEGLQTDGKIYTLEKEKSYEPILEKTFLDGKISNNVNILFGPATQSLYSLELNSFDLVFVDAAKKEYDQYYDIIIPQAKQGAVIIFDNVLWKGQVLDKELRGISKAIHDLNQKILNDNRVENFILPIRDGLNIITIL